MPALAAAGLWKVGLSIDGLSLGIALSGALAASATNSTPEDRRATRRAGAPLCLAPYCKNATGGAFHIFVGSLAMAHARRNE
jgi:hypothetical protein